jgi:acyl carrier protein
MLQPTRSRESVEALLTKIVKGLRWDDSQMVEVAPGSYLMKDLGLSSIDTFELFALVDAQLGRRFSYESLIVQDGEVREDLTIEEISDFILMNWDSLDSPPLPR